MNISRLCHICSKQKPLPFQNTHWVKYYAFVNTTDNRDGFLTYRVKPSSFTVVEKPCFAGVGQYWMFTVGIVIEHGPQHGGASVGYGKDGQAARNHGVLVEDVVCIRVAHPKGRRSVDFDVGVTGWLEHRLHSAS